MATAHGRLAVTVVICTWNRSKLLSRTLAEFEQLRLPESFRWELLVIDNGSTDDTEAVVRRFDPRLPIRRVVEHEQGLSHARNRALREANGELLLWTDDDVLVGEDWISSYLSAAEQFPRAPFFGGTVDPWFESTAPRWIADNLDQLRGVYAIRRLGDGLRLLQASELPFGANMAMRAAAVEGMRFDPSLGRTGAAMLSGEETEFLRRLRERSGEPGVWVGSARVRHFIPSQRLSLSYLSRYFRGLGLAAGQRAEPEGRTFLGIPLWVWREHLEQTAVMLARWAIKDDRWVQALRRRAYLAGYIHGRRRGAGTAQARSS